MANAASSARKTILFEWEGKDAKGGKQKGMISSPNADLVKAKLRRQGIIPSKIRKKRKTRGTQHPTARTPFKSCPGHAGWRGYRRDL